MIKQLGIPEVMLTLSIADNLLPSLKKFYETLNIETEGKSLFDLNSSYPFYQTIFDFKMLDAYLKEFLGLILPIQDIFTTFDFQNEDIFTLIR